MAGEEEAVELEGFFCVRGGEKKSEGEGEGSFFFMEEESCKEERH